MCCSCLGCSSILHASTQCWLQVDLCHVAAGMSDAYWEFLLKPWDCAAGVLLVREAGGQVTTLPPVLPAEGSSSIV